MDPLTLIIALTALAIAVAWLLLPIALFGIKPRLDEMIRLMRAQQQGGPAAQAIEDGGPTRPCWSCREPVSVSADACPHCGVRYAA